MNRLRKTALEWIVESGNADQLMRQSHGNGAQKCLGVEGNGQKTDAVLDSMFLCTISSAG